MQAIVLVKAGAADKAFEFRETPKPAIKDDEVLIKVQFSGINFADILARKGLYRDAPPMPCVLGYDVSGIVESVGRLVTHLKIGDRVTAFTRFGGYAEYVATNAMGAIKIPDSLDGASATALTTQYGTAYYCCFEAVNLHEGDKVLIHAAAGGVGTAQVQFALHKKCIVFGTAGSDEKIEMLKKAGVQYPINYRKQNYMDVVKQATNGKGADVVFDSLGGRYVKEGISLLNAGGKIICIGAAEMSDKTNLISKAKTGLAFGIYHPAQFIIPSKSFIGVNMLRIADEKPQILQNCLIGTIKLYELSVCKPIVGRVFPAKEIAKAHQLIESRQSTGKVVVEW